MADLYSAIGQNYKTKAGNGIAGKTYILLLEKEGGGNLTQAIVDNVVRSLGAGVDQGSGKADAFTVAGVTGSVTGTAVYLAVQGTGTITTDTSAWNGVTSASVTVVTSFEQNPA